MSKTRIFEEWIKENPSEKKIVSRRYDPYGNYENIETLKSSLQDCFHTDYIYIDETKEIEEHFEDKKNRALKLYEKIVSIIIDDFPTASDIMFSFDEDYPRITFSREETDAEFRYRMEEDFNAHVSKLNEIQEKEDRDLKRLFDLIDQKKAMEKKIEELENKLNVR